ncbi:MAG TPA: Ig-like domain-containing protein, partial [Gemmatimonadales bacterium]
MSKSVLVALGALTLVLACLDERPSVVGPNPPPPSPPPPAAVVSNPVQMVAATSTGLSRSIAVTSDASVAYVALPPGTIPNGGFATISNTRTGSSLPVAMEDGGFDAVPIGAVAGDKLDVNVRLDGGANRFLALVVPLSRRPGVVRTDPPPRKRDVALNTAIVATFSEPIDATSAARIQVLLNGSPVRGSVVLTADGLRADFQPAQQLSPNTDYVLSIPKDL